MPRLITRTKRDVEVGFIEVDIECCEHCHGEHEDCREASTLPNSTPALLLRIRERICYGYVVYEWEWEALERQARKDRGNA